MTQESLFAIPEKTHAWRPVESLPDLSRHREIGFDLESTGRDSFRDEAIGVSVCVPDDPDPKRWSKWYLPFAHKGGGNLSKSIVVGWMNRELRDKDLAGLNIKTDAHWSRKLGVDLAAIGARLHDVAFPAALLNENRFSGFGLEALSEEYLPDPEDRKVHPCNVKPEDFHRAHAGEIAERAESDARLVLMLRQQFKAKIEAENLTRVLDLEDALIHATCEMEFNGARIDRGKLERWRREVSDEVERSLLDLYRETHQRVNPDSPQDMRKLFDLLKLEYPRNEENDTTFDEERLEKVTHPVVQRALRARKLKSLKNKYLDKYLKALDSNNILRFQLHQLRGNEYGTVTGRYSSAAPSTGGANIQQVPKVERQQDDENLRSWIIRELFIPDDGMLWASADASQIEYRLFGHYSDSEKIIRAYNENPDTDFHQFVCDLVRTVTPEFSRYSAKTFNFLMIYGGGKDKAARTLKLDRSQSDKLYEAYDEAFPEAKRLVNRASNIARTRGYVKTFLGRRRRYPDAQRLHSALNAVIQGTAADIMKLKILEAYRNRAALGCHKLRLTVHDELCGDVYNQASLKLWKDFLDTPSVDLKVPITWDVTVGANWAEAA